LLTSAFSPLANLERRLGFWPLDEVDSSYSYFSLEALDIVSEADFLEGLCIIYFLISANSYLVFSLFGSFGFYCSSSS
jgi:hypothetical protein